MGGRRREEQRGRRHRDRWEEVVQTEETTTTTTTTASKQPKTTMTEMIIVVVVVVVAVEIRGGRHLGEFESMAWESPPDGRRMGATIGNDVVVVVFGAAGRQIWQIKVPYST
jgi:hypothetical protein